MNDPHSDACTAAVRECNTTGAHRAANMQQALDGWTSCVAMQRLVRMSGGDWDSTRPLAPRLEFLETFSERWDFRKGAERLDATTLSFSSEDERTIEQAVAELGLTRALPLRLQSYDYMLVLGGVALSCKLRTEFAAEIHQQMGVAAGAVVLLGASRRIPENERGVADTFARGAATEFDMLNAAAEGAFNLTDGHDDAIEENANENLRAVIRRFRRRGLPRVESICAPSSDEARRANTDDTYVYFARVMDIQAGTNILIVSSQIYFPFHTFGAMRALALPYDVSVEVVGFPIERASGSGALRGTNNLLQEVRSGIQAAVRLNQALTSHA